MSTLDSFVSSSSSSARLTPTPIATSQEIRDRGSAFLATLYRAPTSTTAHACLDHHKRLRAHAHKDPTHSRDVYDITAWRCMVLKPGHTGLAGPDDFEVENGYNNGGEKWAGGRLLKVMQTEGVMDAVVIVSRWFGGTLLGSARFTHIETCAREVCKRFKKVEEMEESIQTLKTLDDLLAVLRAELETLTTADSEEDPCGSKTSQAKSKAPDYAIMQDALDLTKAQRLIRARESAINTVKSLIKRRKEKRGISM